MISLWSARKRLSKGRLWTALARRWSDLSDSKSAVMDFGWFWMILVAFEIENGRNFEAKALYWGASWMVYISFLRQICEYLPQILEILLMLRHASSDTCQCQLLPLRICKPIFSGQKSTTSFPYPATIVGFRMRPCLICGPFRATSKNCLIRGLFKQTGPALGGVHGNPMESNYAWPALSRKMPSLLRCSDT